MSSFSPVAPEDDAISNRLLADDDASPAKPPRAPAAGRPRVEIAIVAAGQIVQQVLTLGTGIVIAHMLGAAGYGLVNLLRSLFTAIPAKAASSVSTRAWPRSKCPLRSAKTQSVPSGKVPPR